MLLGEPNHTDFDIHFQCFGISVRIHPGFWAISALLSLPAGREPMPVLGFALAIFLSILIHEMGHALAFFDTYSTIDIRAAVIFIVPFLYYN